MCTEALLLSFVLHVATGADGGNSSSLQELLAKHRSALGGEKAIQLSKRWKVTQRLKMYGLDGTSVEFADEGRRRTEFRLPELPFETINVWDGERLIERGTNGDVRQLGRSEVEKKRTDVAISSLEYLREGAVSQIELLPPLEEKGQKYDRIRITADRGIPEEVWLDVAGLPRRQITISEGSITTVFIDEYAKYQGIMLPKRLRQTSSQEKNETVIEVVSVEFPSEFPKALFQPPAPQFDAVFPAGRTSITLPLALLENRWVLIQASLSGHLGTFLLDTGASSTVYDFAFLKRVGAKPKGEIAPAGGLFKGISFVRTGTSEFGELKFGPQTVIAIDLHAPDSPLPTQLDGILGYDFLSRFPFTIDYVGGWLTFWKPGSYQPLPQELPIPIEFVGTSIRVPVQINAEDAGSFELDIGNGGLCAVQHTKLAHPLSLKNAKSLFYEHGQEYGSGSASAYVVHADLTVGVGAQSVTWKSAPLDLLNVDDPHASSIQGAGNIGHSWLKHFRITFDYGNSKIYLLQRQSFRSSALTGDYGMEMRPVKGKLVVRDVASNTPASLAGLKSGDELIDVDGIPALLLNNQAPRLLSSPIPGEAHAARFRRGKDVVTVQLTAIAIP